MDNLKQKSKFERFFKVKERGSSLATEATCGVLMWVTSAIFLATFIFTFVSS